MGTVVLLALTLQASSVYAQDTVDCDIRLLVGAIDIPLTVENVRRCGVHLDDLMSLVDHPDASLYVRGRAVSALALLDHADREMALKVIALSNQFDVIRDQSVRSLLALYRSEGRQVELGFMIELLTTAGPRMARTIQLHGLRQRPSARINVPHR